MNESVKKLLKESMWDLATCANGEPNVVPGKAEVRFRLRVFVPQLCFCS